MSEKTAKQSRKPRMPTPVRLIVEREFVGEKTVTEAMIPVLFEDLKRKANEIRTFDKSGDTA